MAAELQASNFDQEVIKSATPVVVDFSAVWCGPCKMLAPVIDKLAQAYEGKAKVFKMDVDNSRDIATKFGIRGVPTVIFFKGGAEKDRVVGLVPYEMLDSKLSALVDSSEPEVIKCPQCQSTQITSQEKGFSLGKAAAGGVLLGPVGLLGGALGSKKINVVCLNCGHSWSPVAKQ